MERQQRLREENGLNFYLPHPKQDLFHRAGEIKRRYARTGNRFGKSDMGAAEDCAFALGYRPWYPEGDPARTAGIPRHSTKGVIVCQDWDKAQEVFTNTEEGAARGKLFRFLPKDSIVNIKRGRSGGGIAEVTIKSIHGGHSKIHIETVRSFVQNPLGMESSDWDWIHVDEPCPRKMWIALARGLVDRDGSAWFTCTPLTEPWINDYFIPRDRTRDTFDKPEIFKEKVEYTDVIEEVVDGELVQEEVTIEEYIDMWVVMGQSSDNPYNSKRGLARYIAELNPEEIECRTKGIPLALSGLVYKDFDLNLHVYGKGHQLECPHGWKDEVTPPKDYTIRTFIDPHPKIPHAVLHFATSPTGQTFIFREMFRPGLISDITEHVKAQVEGYFVRDFLIDPLAYITNPITGTCMADEFYNAGIPVAKAVKDLAYGILKTQAKFRERDEHGNATIFVHRSCSRFLYEIDRYVWNEKGEKPVDEDDHMMENLYRAVLSGLTFVENTENNYKYTEPEYNETPSWSGPSFHELVGSDNFTANSGKSRRRYPH